MIFVKTPAASVAAKPQPVATAQLSHIGGAGNRTPGYTIYNPQPPQANTPRHV